MLTCYLHEWQDVYLSRSVEFPKYTTQLSGVFLSSFPEFSFFKFLKGLIRHNIKKEKQKE